MRPKPVVLLILDGFGIREVADDNAICHASTPTFDRLAQNAPSAYLETSGEAVGLPNGQMGNSEVGHMNLGTGRIVYQDFTRLVKQSMRATSKPTKFLSVRVVKPRLKKALFMFSAC